jgi:hypothetical protein
LRTALGDRTFNAHLKANGLEVRNNTFRSDAMWLAKDWEGLLVRVTHCPHANPVAIHQWIRARHDGPAAELAC